MNSRLRFREHHTLDEYLNPFQRGPLERPMRLTFHEGSLVKSNSRESRATELLSRLTALPELDLATTGSGEHPRVVVLSESVVEDMVPVCLQQGGDLLMNTGVSTQIGLFREDRLADRFTDEATFEEALLPLAHRELDRDLFVTQSPHLLAGRDEWPLERANIHTPVEAAKIVGAFLHSRGQFNIPWGPSSKKLFERSTFYLVLARHRLASMWPLREQCVEASRRGRTGLAERSWGVIARASRALQSKDELAQRFYGPQSLNSAEESTYHFEYLLLLLTGALDALARIAYRTYGPNYSEGRASFNQDTFVDKLEERGAIQLAKAARAVRGRPLHQLLYQIRNLIHSASFAPVSERDAAREDLIMLRVPSEISERIRLLAYEIDDPDRHGLRVIGPNVLVEPYTLAEALLDCTFAVIEALAPRIEVGRLIPDFRRRALSAGPPNTGPWDMGPVFELLA